LPDCFFLVKHPGCIVFLFISVSKKKKINLFIIDDVKNQQVSIKIIWKKLKKKRFLLLFASQQKSLFISH
jgi:hypothetical protein